VAMDLRVGKRPVPPGLLRLLPALTGNPGRAGRRRRRPGGTGRLPTRGSMATCPARRWAGCIRCWRRPPAAGGRATAPAPAGGSDGAVWQLDAQACAQVARTAGVPVAVEISRSGRGAHVWMFFTGPVPALDARALGFALLRQAMAVRGGLGLDSYDRFFPAQD